MKLTTLLFSFQGRINRARYWSILLIYLVILLICLICAFIGIGISTAVRSSTVVSYPLMAIFVIVGLSVMWSSIAAGIKRLHDRDQSGWWMLGFLAVSSLVSLLEETAATPISKTMFTATSFAVTVWIVIELGCLRGTAGPNRFGPDPLQPPVATS